MKLIAIGCRWNILPPDFFSREAFVVLPGNDSDEETNIDETTIYSMGGIDGCHGPVNRVICQDNDMDGHELLNLIRDEYDFVDLNNVRFIGECLTPDAFRLIRDFSIAIIDENEELAVTIETSSVSKESLDRLDQLMNRRVPLIENVCIIVKIPGKDRFDEFEHAIEEITSGLTACIMSTRSDSLQSTTLLLRFDEQSSMEAFTHLVISIKKACMEDDMFEGMNGIALNSFIIALIPDQRTDGAIISSAIEHLAENMIDERQAIVIPWSRSIDPFFDLHA